MMSLRSGTTNLVRNVLGQDTTVVDWSEPRLKFLALSRWTVDRENSSGQTVSGLLVCYDNRGDNVTWDDNRGNGALGTCRRI